MKRFFSVFLILILTLCLVLFTACVDNKDDKKYYDDEDGWTPAYSLVVETKI